MPLRLTHIIQEVKKKVFTKEFGKFLIVGVLSAVIEWSLLIFFVEKISLDYLLGNIAAFLITNIFTYILSRRYVFNSSNDRKVMEAILFLLCLMGGLLINQIVLWTFVEYTSLDYRIAKVIAIAITVIWNFFTRKYLVFRSKKPSV
jgi:putative flippase GtrA